MTDPRAIDLSEMQSALGLSAHSVSRDPRQFSAQILGRWSKSRSSNIDSLLERARLGPEGPWLRPLVASLTSPRGPLVKTLYGHSATLKALAVSFDGRHALSASADHTMRLWDVNSGATLRMLTGHSTEIVGVSLSENGRLAVSGSRDGIVKVWDLDGVEEPRSLSGPLAQPWIFSVTTDGRRILTSSGHETLSVWSLETGAVVQTLTGRPVHAAALSGDGRIVITAYGGLASIRDLDAGSVLYDFRYFKSSGLNVDHVAISSDGKVAVAGNANGAVLVWESQQPNTERHLDGNPLLAGLATSADGRRIMSAARYPIVWDIDGGKSRQIAGSVRIDATVVAMSGDGCRALSTATRRRSIAHAGQQSEEERSLHSGSSGTGIQVWDLESRAELRHMPGHESRVNSVTISADGHTAVSASDDETLKVWNVRRGVVRRTLSRYARELGTAGLLWGIKRLFYDLYLGKEGSGLPPETERPYYCVALSADGKWAVSSSWRTSFWMWYVPSGVHTHALDRDAFGCDRVAISGDGRTVLSAAGGRWTHSVSVWDVQSTRTVATFRTASRMRDCALSGDGRRAIVCFPKSAELAIYELGNRSTRHVQAQGGNVLSVAMSPNGHRAVLGSADGIVRVYDLDAWQELSALPGHELPVIAVALSGDARWVASACGSKVVRLWDVERAKLVAEFQADSEVICCAVSSNGPTIIAGDVSGATHMLTLEGAGGVPSPARRLQVAGDERPV